MSQVASVDDPIYVCTTTGAALMRQFQILYFCITLDSRCVYVLDINISIISCIIVVPNIDVCLIAGVRAAMLMCDYPLKTDMETVSFCVCVLCICMSSIFWSAFLTVQLWQFVYLFFRA